MKQKFVFCFKYLAMSWAIVNVFIIINVAVGQMPIGNYINKFYATVLILGPLAGSLILAVIVSEIADKRRLQNVQENKTEIKQNKV